MCGDRHGQQRSERDYKAYHGRLSNLPQASTTSVTTSVATMISRAAPAGVSGSMTERGDDAEQQPANGSGKWQLHGATPPAESASLPWTLRRDNRGGLLGRFRLVAVLFAHAQRLQIAVQCRALHPDERRGLGDIAREAADLRT